MVTGPILIVIFILAIALLLVSIIKFRLNAFVSLLITSLVTALLVGMPIADIASTISGGFGSTLSGIGIVTGLGVMLGKFMFESGGIETMANVILDKFGEKNSPSAIAVSLSGIGIVTGLGVMLGKFMFESGGIETMANVILDKFGEKNSPSAIAVSGFLTGIPVFGDVVYIMFAPMLRVLSKKTGISMVSYACAISVATTCTFAMVIPTPAPLAVSESLGIDVGIFFFYALLTGFIAAIVGGIIYGKYLDKQDQKNKHFYTFEDLEEEKVLAGNVGGSVGSSESNGYKTSKNAPSFIKAISMLLVPIILILLGSFVPLAIGEESFIVPFFKFVGDKNKNAPSFIKAISMLLVPIILILLGSFVPLAIGEESFIVPFFKFVGDKNVAMLIGVIYAALISRPYIKKSVSEIMNDAADQVGLILLITGAGGAFGKVLQATGIADYIANTLSGYSIPILVLCFMISQIIRCAQGSTTVALLTTASILGTTIANSSVSPILCAIAICAGGIGLSLPNDSGFWAISRFFKISVSDTIRAWTLGGFVAGLTALGVVSILSLFQNFLPGLM